MSIKELPRRRVLRGLLALGAAGCTGAPAVKPAHEPPERPGDEWGRVRVAFDLSPEWIHMTSFLLASHPRPVRDAIEAFRKQLDDNPVTAIHTYLESEHVREAAAAYMGVPAAELSLTGSTTMGLSSLYLGLPLKAGDEVLTTTHDHYSTHESLRFAAERTGAMVRKIALYGEGAKATAVSMEEALARAISPRTRVVAVTWVHSGSGVKTPVRAFAEVVARANRRRPARDRILLCVDGVHGFGVEDVTMADLGCDFFVAGCHKWLFGPRGTGLVWGKAEHWPKLRPIIPQFGREEFDAWLRGGPPPVTNANVMTPGGFHDFEHRWALPAAFAFHRSIGKANVAARIHALNRQCKEGMKAMKHVTLHTPLDDGISAGLICFEVRGMDPDGVVKLLREQKIIASRSLYATSYARLAPSLVNSEAEVEATLRALRQLA